MYGVDAIDICRLLPEKVRPIGMSVKCKQIPDKNCGSVGHTDTSNSIKKMLQDSNPLAIVKAYNKYIPNKTSIEDLKRLVEEFFSLEVTTKRTLHTQIVLRESEKVIGHMKSEFYLESQLPRVLYVSDELDDEDDIVTEIIENLYNEISQTFPVEVPLTIKTKLLNWIVKYFKANPSKKLKILSRDRIEVSDHDVPKKSNFSFEKSTQCFLPNGIRRI